MFESCITVSQEGSLEREWRENIFLVGGLGNALVIYFAWKKKMPEVNVYVSSWAMTNVSDAGQGLDGKRIVSQDKEPWVEAHRWQYRHKYKLQSFLHYPLTPTRKHAPQKRQ